MDPVHGRIIFSGSGAHWPEKASLSKGYPTQVPKNLELLVHPKADKEVEEMGRGFPEICCEQAGFHYGHVRTQSSSQDRKYLIKITPGIPSLTVNLEKGH